MSALVERMGPMYHEGAYFDDAVTVSFQPPFKFGINLFILTLQISFENQNLVLRISNLICLDSCGWLQRSTTFWSLWILSSD
jgi:hypothetical protein